MEIAFSPFFLPILYNKVFSIKQAHSFEGNALADVVAWLPHRSLVSKTPRRLIVEQEGFPSEPSWTSQKTSVSCIITMHREFFVLDFILSAPKPYGENCFYPDFIAQETRAQIQILGLS